MTRAAFRARRERDAGGSGAVRKVAPTNPVRSREGPSHRLASRVTALRRIVTHNQRSSLNFFAGTAGALAPSRPGKTPGAAKEPAMFPNKCPSPFTTTEATLRRDADVTLREALVLGDEAAWRQFANQHGRLIFATIARIVRRFRLAGDSDVVREIEATLAVELVANDKAKLRAFQPDRGVRFSTWIAMLASHAAYDYLRRLRREPRSEDAIDADTLVSRAPDPCTLCERSERARLVETLLSGFTDKDRLFLELYYGEGLDPDQVAARMGISVGTVYSKKHKLQSRLEALLEKDAA